MGIFLDSANADEAKVAFDTGFVCGITTNPKILSQVKRDPFQVLKELCTLSTGPVFYQLTAPTPKGRKEEALKAVRINPNKMALKIPCTTENLQLMAHLANSQHIPCAATAVYSAAQGYLASEAGAKYLIPYVNRATASGLDGLALVTQLAQVARASGKGAEVLAASLKTPDEVVAAVLAGANHVTIPFETIKALGNHPKSDEAIAEFAKYTNK